MEIILASQSPRRQELLQMLVKQFTIKVAAIDESILTNETPFAYVQRMAFEKATKIASLYPEALVIGSDTTVVIDQNILGKPANDLDAQRILRQLSGRTHDVYTAVSIIYQSTPKTFVSSAQVTFATLTEEEITKYLALNEYQDKAGAYGIQGAASKFIEKIHGDYYAIVGLPIQALYQELKQMVLPTDLL